MYNEVIKTNELENKWRMTVTTTKERNSNIHSRFIS